MCYFIAAIGQVSHREVMTVGGRPRQARGHTLSWSMISTFWRVLSRKLAICLHSYRFCFHTVTIHISNTIFEISCVLRCTMADLYSFGECQQVYIACRSIFKGRDAKIRRLRKTKNALQRNKSPVESVVRDMGEEKVTNIALYLLKNRKHMPGSQMPSRQMKGWKVALLTQTLT